MINSLDWGPLLREFWRFDRRATLLAVGLNLAAALLEGLALLLLLPMLAVAGIIDASPGAVPTLPLPGVVLATLASFSPSQRLLIVLAGFVTLVALQSALAYARELHTQQLRLRFVDHLRKGLFGALARARWSFLSRHHGSEFLSILTNDIQRCGQGAFFLLSLFTQLALLPVYVGVACQLSLPVTLMALLTGLALWWILRKSRNAAQQSGVALSKSNQGMFNAIQEFLAALKLIKIHGEEKGYQRQFGQIIDHLREQQLEFSVVSSRTQAIFRVGGALAMALLVYGSIVLVQLPAPALLVLIAVFTRMLPQLSQLHLGLQQLTHMAPAFDNWQRWMAKCATARETSAVDAPVNFMKSGIRLQNVSFRHPDSVQPLQVQDTLIPIHRTTAIIGPSGAGKTSFLDLLSGLNAPDSGSILVDGEPIERLAGWRRRIAYVPQETAILDGTIRDNLTWGSQDRDDAQMLAVLDQAAAGDFVRALPRGLDTWVGERGVRLSGGERQRLALARALLRSPELLILDEATNALDHEHQQLVFKALRELHGRMTVLIVTHRYEEISALLDGVVRVEAGNVSSWRPLPAHA